MSIRLRLEFAAELLTDSMTHAGLHKCWYEPLESTKSIGDLANELVMRFELEMYAASDLQLSSGGFTLPHIGRLSLLRDGDLVAITSLLSNSGMPSNAGFSGVEHSAKHRPLSRSHAKTSQGAEHSACISPMCPGDQGGSRGGSAALAAAGGGEEAAASAAERGFKRGREASGGAGVEMMAASAAVVKVGVADWGAHTTPMSGYDVAAQGACDTAACTPLSETPPADPSPSGGDGAAGGCSAGHVEPSWLPSPSTSPKLGNDSDGTTTVDEHCEATAAAARAAAGTAAAAAAAALPPRGRSSAPCTFPDLPEPYPGKRKRQRASEGAADLEKGQAGVVTTGGVRSRIKQETRTCLVCLDMLQMNVQIPLERMRTHVAGHMLRNETSACGFCGKEGCTSYMDQGAKRGIIVPASDCPYFYKFNTKGLLKPLVCSNQPIMCCACTSPHYVWKYHMRQHWEEQHPEQLLAGRFPEEYMIGEAERASVLSTNRLMPRRSSDVGDSGGGSSLAGAGKEVPQGRRKETKHSRDAGPAAEEADSKRSRLRNALIREGQDNAERSAGGASKASGSTAGTVLQPSDRRQAPVPLRPVPVPAAASRPLLHYDARECAPHMNLPAAWLSHWPQLVDGQAPFPGPAWQLPPGTGRAPPGGAPWQEAAHGVPMRGDHRNDRRSDVASTVTSSFDRQWGAADHLPGVNHFPASAQPRGGFDRVAAAGLQLRVAMLPNAEPHDSPSDVQWQSHMTGSAGFPAAAPRHAVIEMTAAAADAAAAAIAFTGVPTSSDSFGVLLSDDEDPGSRFGSGKLRSFASSGGGIRQLREVRQAQPMSPTLGYVTGLA